MRIQIVTPATAGSQSGNNVTTDRWAALLRELGHSVRVAREWSREGGLLVALHARRSHGAIADAKKYAPDTPIFVVLTGTDLYQDSPKCAEVRASLECATRILVLQPLAREALPPELHAKTRVVFQSAEAPPNPPPPDPDRFEVCVLGHLRPVKDPFCAAAAARMLPETSTLIVTQVGAALSEEMEQQAYQEAQENRRYRWLGELPRPEALQVLARSRLLALTSRSEGGANVVSEALACGTPVVSSRIDGSVGILGPDYPGYFPAGDPYALAGLLRRAEEEPEYYTLLQTGCRRLASLVTPAHERDTWAAILDEVGEPDRSPLSHEPGK